MPKIGYIKIMNNELHIEGMWDGSFWARVEWDPLRQAWLIPEAALERILEKANED